jgi:mono/diheme cytochrome c family protein
MACYGTRVLKRLIGLWLGASICVVAACLPTHSDMRRLGVDKLTYHYNSQRTGWNDREIRLTPGNVSSARFGLLWESLPLDYFDGIPPRLFAAPLYVRSVNISTGRFAGRSFSILFVVATTGYAYAMSTIGETDAPPGTILWRTHLALKPCDASTMGNLATPIIDLERQRLYVTTCDDEVQWQTHALDIRSGQELSGWPVNIDHDALNSPGINQNGSTRFSEKDGHTQRGALNLSADGSRLYVSFGLDNSSGWLVAVDTNRARVATAFSTTAVTSEIQGGMWASGGPSVDRDGNVYIATGSSSTQMLKHAGIPGVFPDSAHSWGQSILKFRDDPKKGFELLGTYTPFNYCLTAANDIDLGSSGTVVIDLDANKTATPHLLALGGAKQGNVYLLDRTHMPGGVTKRHPCSSDSSSDLSLLAPENQAQFGRPGPVNVFGPYTDEHAMFDQARSRTTLAYFHDAMGEDYIFVTGSSKRGSDFSQSTPPGLARLTIVTAAGKPAFLRVDQLEQTQAFQNPGSPVITSSGGKEAIVWVLDENAPRTASLYGKTPPQPALYAFDALSLRLLWKTAQGVLATSGKYNEPTIVNGSVFVGTDRIQAFGLRPTRSKTGEAASEEFRTLFDGKTLNHWRGDPTLWFVQEGSITGRSDSPISHNTSLVHDGNFRNFELHFKYRFLSPMGNSGVQYRSRPFPEHKYSVAGYQANVVTLDAKERYAMLWDENARGILALLGERTEIVERLGKVDRKVLGLVNTPQSVWAAEKPYPEWNDYVVVAYGNHLVHAVNGMLATDVTDDDFEGRASEGYVALQLHPGPPMGVQYKDIRIKELVAPPDLAGRFQIHPAPEPLTALTSDAAAAIQTGRAIYAQRCAACHDTRLLDAPPKETLEQLPHDQIVHTLTLGVMQPMAVGLEETDINAVANYLNSTQQTP